MGEHLLLCIHTCVHHYDDYVIVSNILFILLSVCKVRPSLHEIAIYSCLVELICWFLLVSWVLNSSSMESARRGSEPCVEQSFTLKNENHGSEVMSKLNVLRSESSFTDAILCVGHEEYPCHRNVLAVSSPYFKALFTSNFREGKDARIVFNDISPWTVRRVIEYAYTGHLEITVDNAQDMLAAGSLFQFPDIMTACCQFLAQHLHPSNCLGIEDFAHLHVCDQLESEAHQFTLDNFSAVVEYEEFLELPLPRLITYLASDLIDVRTEETVFEATLLWLEHNLELRRSYVPEVMSHIRFATIGVEYIDEYVECNKLMRTCTKCLALLQDAKKFHESKTDQHGQRRRSMQAETFTPRPSTVAKEVMVLVGGLDNINYMVQSTEVYDPLKDKWNPLPDMPHVASWFSGTALHNDVYITGGIQDGHIMSTVWKFASIKRQWEEVSSMLTPRARHASAALGDRLYVVGGVSLVGNRHVVAVESIEAYDWLTNQWTVAGQSPFPRKQSLLVPYNDRLVEIGGTQCGARVKTMESYHCNSTTITHTGEQFVLPDCVQYAQIVVLHGIFYILWEDTKKLISLNPDKQSFRRLADMHYCHKHSGATILQGKIYVAGGYINSKPCRIVECYDPSTDTWTIMKNMRQARACHSCVTIQMCWQLCHHTDVLTAVSPYRCVDYPRTSSHKCRSGLSVLPRDLLHACHLSVAGSTHSASSVATSGHCQFVIEINIMDLKFQIF